MCSEAQDGRNAARKAGLTLVCAIKSAVFLVICSSNVLVFGPVEVVLAEAGVTARCSSPPWPCDGEHLESLCSAPSFLFPVRPGNVVSSMVHVDTWLPSPPTGYRVPPHPNSLTACVRGGLNKFDSTNMIQRYFVWFQLIKFPHFNEWLTLYDEVQFINIS